MNPAVIVNTEWIDILDALVAVAAPWNGAIVHLYKTLIAITPNLVIGDLDEADFTNYAASSAVVWGAAHYDPLGTPVVAGDAKAFNTGVAPTVFNTIYGYYLTDGAGTKLIFARQFDNPVILTQANQGFEVIPSYPVVISQ